MMIIYKEKNLTTGMILNNGAKLTRKSPFDAGQDVHSAEDTVVEAGGSKLVSTELFTAIHPNFVGLLWSRSGLSVKHGIECGAGCIDSNYRGEVKVHLFNHGSEPFVIKKGDRIAQLLTLPISLENYEVVDELPDSDRGVDGFGSSGV